MPDIENLPQIVDDLVAKNTALEARVAELEGRAPVAGDNGFTPDQTKWTLAVLHKYFGGEMPPVQPDAPVA